MEVFIIRLLQFMLAISLLVLLHEGGHFFFAKLFGVRVERFCLFFDPWRALWEFKPKNSDTTYGLGWLPLGGYCKIAGMIDESFDKEQMKREPQPWEFRTHPAWQRLLIMVGGVLVNFLLALFIYAMVLFAWGDSYYDVTRMQEGMYFNKEAKAMGFQDGDVLLRHDGERFGAFTVDVFRDLSEAREVVVRRKGKEVRIALSGDISLLDMLQKEPAFCRPLVPAVVDSVMQGSPAEKAGITKGCRILAIDSLKAPSWNAFDEAMLLKKDVFLAARGEEAVKNGISSLTSEEKKENLRARNTVVVFQKQGKTLADTARIVLQEDMTMGVVKSSIATLYKPTTVEYGFLESLPAGVCYGMNTLKGYVDDLKYVFTKDGAKSLGGFGAIGSLFPPTWDWMMFWRMTAFLSIILAFMNILPIPALDGGHVLFLLYEIIFRRKPSEKFLIWAEYVGFGLLILLLVVANLNDVLRWMGVM